MKRKNILISLFSLLFVFIFHFESLRAFYLEPAFNRELPKMKFLFPPAGWIMFFNIDRGYGSAKVYGVANGVLKEIDPHKIFETKAVWYDNIHRNVVSEVLAQDRKKDFCGYLEQKFPQYEQFAIAGVYYPDVLDKPMKKYESLQYVCR